MTKSDSVAHLLTAFASRQQLEVSLMQQVQQEGQPKCWLGPTTSRQSEQECATEAQDYSQTQDHQEIK